MRPSGSHSYFHTIMDVVYSSSDGIFYLYSKVEETMADPPETPVAGESPVTSTTTVASSPPTGQVSLPNPTAAPTQTTVTTNMVPTGADTNT